MTMQGKACLDTIKIWTELPSNRTTIRTILPYKQNYSLNTVNVWNIHYNLNTILVWTELQSGTGLQSEHC